MKEMRQRKKYKNKDMRKEAVKRFKFLNIEQSIRTIRT